MTLGNRKGTESRFTHLFCLKMPKGWSEVFISFLWMFWYHFTAFSTSKMNVLFLRNSATCKSSSLYHLQKKKLVLASWDLVHPTDLGPKENLLILWEILLWSSIFLKILECFKINAEFLFVICVAQISLYMLTEAKLPGINYLIPLFPGHLIKNS